MAYTAEYVFEHVMHMHDDGDEATGKYDTSDNKEYKNRMLPLINQRLSELWQYTTPSKKGDPGCRAEAPEITDWSEELNLDRYCMDTLCFGVAALMYTIEDTMSANYYQQEYERLLRDLASGRGITSEAEAITDVYAGGFWGDDGEYHYFTGYYPHNEYSKWA